MQLNGIYSCKMEPDSWSEPLNLVKKKSKPVAVVAPSSVIDKNVGRNISQTNSTEIYLGNMGKEEYEHVVQQPEFVSKTRPNIVTSIPPVSFTTTNKDLIGESDISRKEISPTKCSDFVLATEECEGNKSVDSIFSDIVRKNNADDLKDEHPLFALSKLRDSSNVPDPLRPDGLYSMIHSLAASEHKFLTALYMNSLFSTTAPSSAMPPNGNLGFPPSGYMLSPGYDSPSLPESCHTSLRTAPVLNNLLTFADMQHRLWQMVNRQDTPCQNAPAASATTTNYVSSSDTTLVDSQVSDETVPDIAATSTNTLITSPPSESSKTVVKKQKSSSKWSSSMDQKNSTSSATEGSKTQDSGQTCNNQDKKKPHIKKPLNAFMLYMKEMRAKVVAECTLKESAAINQILGRRWHSLTREEQAKYYEKARQERQLHMQLYPGWSARDNYGYGAKKKKRKKERSADPGGNSMKKCRARYGLDQQSQWCKPCRRKKKCIRYMESGESVDGNQSEDNLGSCGSVGEAQTPPDDDGESLHQSLSSPGGLSGLSSLTSPSMILPSPSTSLASPSVSLASPCMSLQSPLTPHESSAFECKPPMNSLGVLPPHQPPATSSSIVGGGGLPIHHHHPTHHPPPGPPLHRNPVGTNPHDINNPLSVNQLTGQCIKTESSSGNKDSSSNARPVISVT